MADDIVKENLEMIRYNQFQQEQADRESFRKTNVSKIMNRFNLILDDTNLKLSQFDEL